MIITKQHPVLLRPRTHTQVASNMDIYCCKRQGFKIKEIANKFNCAESTIKGRLSAMRKEGVSV